MSGKYVAPVRERRIQVSWIRYPIQSSRANPLRILIYARYSTAEQRRRSIDAQIAFCKKFLTRLKVKHFKITIIKDEKLSGELLERPGINKVRRGIRARKWDVILVEDCSRLYRDDVYCVGLVRQAVDNDIRVVCINDFIDTMEPDWEPRLKDTARYHALSNRYCSDRIKRSHEDLWAIGAAICLLRPGYRRLPSTPASTGRPAKGPYFDEIDPQWAPIVREAFERIAAGESPWSVACWLTLVGLPKASNSQSVIWNDDNVVALIRRSVYRGLEPFRDTYSHKELCSGKHKSKLNDKTEVMTRPMEHLRIVDDWLWYSANAVIDKRSPGVQIPKGKDNPNYGIPKNARGPLSELFYCRCCGKMHVDVRTGGGYRCSQVRSGECWIKATALRKIVHEALKDAIIEKLTTLGVSIDRLINDATTFLDDDGRREARISALEARRMKLERSVKRLTTAIASGNRESSTLVAEFEKTEDRLARVCAKLSGLTARRVHCTPPERKAIEDRIQSLVQSVQRMDRKTRKDLEVLVGRFTSVPYSQFGGDKVVLRARFEIRLAGLLPPATRAALRVLLGGPIEGRFESIPMLVDLFEPSTGPKYGLAALELEDQGLGLTKIGKALQITKRRANLAVQYGRALRAAGLTDPFIELNEKPERASRWRRRSPRPCDDDRKPE